jgi:hypothetical protein
VSTEARGTRGHGWGLFPSASQGRAHGGFVKNVGTDVLILIKFMGLFKNVGTHVLKLSSWALAKTVELNLLGTWVPTFLN